MDNELTICGNVTRDPELRYSNSGVAITNFSIAVNERRKNEQGEWVDGDVSFVNVTAWRELGENVAASVKKGDRVIANGKLKVRTFEREDGTKGQSTELDLWDIGVSLKWATYEAQRTRQSSSGGGQRAPQGQRQPDPVYGDEEPF